MADPADLENNAEQRDRLWQQMLHEDEFAFAFAQINIFLVADSMILIAYSLLSTRGSTAGFQSNVLAVFGIAISVSWLHASHFHTQYLHYLVRRGKTYLPDYAQTQAKRPVGLLSSIRLITYLVPTTSILLWIIPIIA